MWALRDDLTLCRDLNLPAVEIEIDAAIVLGWMSNSYSSNSYHASLILDERTIINQIP